MSSLFTGGIICLGTARVFLFRIFSGGIGEDSESEDSDSCSNFSFFFNFSYIYTNFLANFWNIFKNEVINTYKINQKGMFNDILRNFYVGILGV
jgi:hypothetical protein